MPDRNDNRPIGVVINDEVRKDQGETPTFPFGERELAEKLSGGDSGENPNLTEEERARDRRKRRRPLYRGTDI